MNERYKELAKQATEEVMKNTPSFLVTNEMWQEKFAELIVQECGVVAYKTYCQTPGALGIQYKKAIEEHFRVEL